MECDGVYARWGAKVVLLFGCAALLIYANVRGAVDKGGPARPEQNPRPALCRRALLMPLVNPGSLYRRGKRT